MNGPVKPILQDAFERFARACGNKATDPAYVAYQPEFDELINDVAHTLPAYDALVARWDTASQSVARTVRASNNLRRFFEHTGILRSIRDGQFDPSAAARDFEQEVTREHCRLIQRFVLDGLALPFDEVTLRRGRFVRLTDARLRQFSDHAPVSYDRRLGLYLLELEWWHPNPPWGTGLLEDTESPHDRVARLAHPWVTFLNLYDAGKVRVAGIFEWTDSRLCATKRYIEIAEPVWEDRYEYDNDRGCDVWVSEAPRRTVRVHSVDHFVRFLEALNSGYHLARAEAHRTDIAFRYFNRVVENYWTYHLGEAGSSHDRDEDIIVDAITLLESLLLANEKRDKGGVMAARAGAILEASAADQRTVRRTVRRLYRLRSTILHGDVRPQSDAMAAAATDAELFSRRCLVAFLLSGGDRTGILQAATDSRAAEGVRCRITQAIAAPAS